MMNTFQDTPTTRVDPITSQLSFIAQYDDMQRFICKYIADGHREEDECLNMLTMLEKQWNRNKAAHSKETQALLMKIESLEKEVKKLNRQLVDTRSALVRESEEKKTIDKERKTLYEQIRTVRSMLEDAETFRNNDHRERVFSCLDVRRLSPIISDDSSDGASGLDYDRTEESIHGGLNRSTLAHMIDTETNSDEANNYNEPTLLYRPVDHGPDHDDDLYSKPRSSRRKTTNLRQNTHDLEDVDMLDSDSNNLDNVCDFENIEQELRYLETERKEKMVSATSTPAMRTRSNAHASSAKSQSNFFKPTSKANNPSSASMNIQRPHSLVQKKIFKPEICGVCDKKLFFLEKCLKCEDCGCVCHPECRDACPLPCVRITAPQTRSRIKMVLISDYVNQDTNPKVPAIIVHCCNEIERGDNIYTEGLYRVGGSMNDIEKLQQKILKSKTGMPNLSKEDVHVLCGVVKRFLMSLDDQLLTKVLWRDFVAAVECEEEFDQNAFLTIAIKSLPPANLDTLAFLMQHFHAIARHEDRNKMSTKAISRAIAPTIVGNSVREPGTKVISEESSSQIKVMYALFNVIPEEFWSEYVQKTTLSLGSRLLGDGSANIANNAISSSSKSTGKSKRTGTLTRPKLKPLFN